MLKDPLNPLMLLFFLAGTALLVYWGLDFTHYQNVIIFLIASAFGLFMAFNIGGNDVANSFGTSVGAGTLTVRQALLIAAVFEASGAIIAGGEVTKTIRSGIVDIDRLMAQSHIEPLDFILLMMSALLSAALWLLFASRKGLPVSTTHSIVGAIIGASLALGITTLSGADALGLVQWSAISKIALSWVISPLLGGLIAFVVFGLIKRFILEYNAQATRKIDNLKEESRRSRRKHRDQSSSKDPIKQRSYLNAMERDRQLIQYARASGIEEDTYFESSYYRERSRLKRKMIGIKPYLALKRGVPVIAAIGAALITAMLLFKGLKSLHIELSNTQTCLLMLLVGMIAWMVLAFMAQRYQNLDLDDSTFLLFSWMQVFTASIFAFSHGSNDISNAIGPFIAILEMLHNPAGMNESSPIPPVAMISFSVAMIAGLWFIGKEVIMTIGTNLTRMHPASGFAAELSAATLVLIASLTGIPVSSTHILVGAVLGVGVVNRNANWGMMKPIVLAWIVTLPISAVLAGVVLLVLRSIL